MVWLPLMAAEFIIAFIDPYIGFYCLFPGIMTFIFAMCEVNLRARIRAVAIRVGASSDEDAFASLGRTALRGMTGMFRFVAVFGVAITGFCYIGLTSIELSAYTANPFVFAIIPIVWPPTMGIAACVVLIALQVAASVSIFLNQEHIEHMAARYAEAGKQMDAELEGADLLSMRFSVSVLSYGLIVATAACAVISPLRWLGLVGLVYLWGIIIIKIVMGATKKTLRLDASGPAQEGAAIARASAAKQLSEFLPGGYATRLIIGCTWLMWFVILLAFFLGATLGEAGGLQNAFFWLGIVAATGAAASLAHDAGAIGASAMAGSPHVQHETGTPARPA